jgi:antitoxin component YwqK of YwqJK toxin-antitoxin module
LDPFYDNGNPRFRGDTVDGLMQGYWEFYRRDGSLMRSGTFVNDIQVGEWSTYLRDGTVHKVTDFGYPSGANE